MPTREELILEFHARLGRDNVDSWRLSGWGSIQSQEERFRALLRCTRFTGGSVVDFGCGEGDLFKFLESSGYKFDYLGLDFRPDVVERAVRRHGSHFRLIELDDLCLDNVDFVFASGVFQFRDDQHPNYAQELLTGLFNKCNVAVGANFLSDARDEVNKVAGENYLSASDVIKMASKLTQSWVIDHSYHPGNGDMTLGMFRRSDHQKWRRPAMRGGPL